ncbi:hypothetical protein [Emticicia fontis]
MQTQLYRFTSSHIMAMLQDILEDYRDLRNTRLRIYAYEITKSYTIHIHEAKIELLADLLGLSFEKIKRNFQLPESAKYKLEVEKAHELLTELISERGKLTSLFTERDDNCEELRLQDYKITAKIFLLNYILDSGYYDLNSNSLRISKNKSVRMSV